MANRGMQRILINSYGDSSSIDTKIMNNINNSGLTKKKSLGQFMFFSFANIIHSYLDFLFTTLFGF